MERRIEGCFLIISFFHGRNLDTRKRRPLPFPQVETLCLLVSINVSHFRL